MPDRPIPGSGRSRAVYHREGRVQGFGLSVKHVAVKF